MAGFRVFGRDMVSEVDRERQHVAMLDPTTGGGNGGAGGNCTGGVCTNGINCFVKGTLVTTETGLRPIETIVAGDVVLSKDEESGRVVFEPVVRTFVTPDSALVEVALRDEPPLRVTSAHLFWTADRGWIEAQHLASGEPLVTADGRGAEVAKVTRIDARETVYNFEVRETHTYFVGRESIWVHNAQSSCATPFNGDPEGALPPSVNFGPSVPTSTPPGSTSDGGTVPIHVPNGEDQPIPIVVFQNPPGGMGYTENHDPGGIDIGPSKPSETPNYDGYYVPWKTDTVYITHLGDGTPDNVQFCGTGSMNGCSFFVGGDPHHPLVGHMNYNGDQIPEAQYEPGMSAAQYQAELDRIAAAQLAKRDEIYNQMFNDLKHQYPELQNGEVITPNDYYPVDANGKIHNQFGNAFGVKQPDGTWKFYYKQDGIVMPPKPKPTVGQQIGSCIGKLCGSRPPKPPKPPTTNDPQFGQGRPFWPPSPPPPAATP